MPARITGLTALARMYDIQPAYVNIAGERRTASPDALLQTLRSLGADVESAADVRAALALLRPLAACGGRQPARAARVR